MVFLRFLIFQVKDILINFDEFKNIFLKSWLMIFREDEIPNPGDFKIFDKFKEIF